MKNKFRKVIAALVVGVTLCGSVLTAQAAEGCTHTAVRRHSYTEYSSAMTHTYGTGQICTYKIVRNYDEIYCLTCKATLQTGILASSTTVHSAQH